MTKVLIGLAGPAGSGKDTIGEFLWKNHGFLTMAFADRLKDVASTMFGWERLALAEREFKETVDPVWGITPREALQRLGTEAVQGAFGKDFWVRAWRQLYDQVRHGDDVVVTDVRFEHEAEVIRALGGLIIHVRRAAAPGHNGVPGHISEAGIKEASDDWILPNNGTLLDLEREVETLVEYLWVRGH